MRFKVSMINDIGNCHEETVIANNEKKAKMNVQMLNPKIIYLRSEIRSINSIES